MELFIRFIYRVIGNDVSVNILFFNIVWVIYYGCFNDVFVFVDGIFYFSSIYVVVRNIDYIIYMVDDFVYVVGILLGIVVGEVFIVKMWEVCDVVVFMIIVGCVEYWRLGVFYIKEVFFFYVGKFIIFFIY